MRARVTLACLVLLGGHTAFPRATSFAVETGFLDRTTSVNGHSYRYQVYVPPDYDPAKAWPVVMWLHGNGTQGVSALTRKRVNLDRAHSAFFGRRAFCERSASRSR